jgi:uncharacterized protein
MKISGSATVHAPPAQVWRALNDPAVLAATIPGCDHLAVTAPGTCRLIVTTAVASTQGTYTGEVEVSDRQEPTSFRLAATAAGAPGTLSASALVQLAANGNGSTDITYHADAAPGGLIAAAGQRLLASTAKKLAGDFLAAVDVVLRDQAAAVPGPAGVADAPSMGPPPGVRADGAAGVSSPTDAAARGASGVTGERLTADRQPAGRPVARPPTRGFVPGVLVGTGATLAAVALARLLARRSR